MKLYGLKWYGRYCLWNIYCPPIFVFNTEEYPILSSNVPAQRLDLSDSLAARDSQVTSSGDWHGNQDTTGDFRVSLLSCPNHHSLPPYCFLLSLESRNDAWNWSSHPVLHHLLWTIRRKWGEAWVHGDFLGVAILSWGCFFLDFLLCYKVNLCLILKHCSAVSVTGNTQFKLLYVPILFFPHS